MAALFSCSGIFDTLSMGTLIVNAVLLCLCRRWGIAFILIPYLDTIFYTKKRQFEIKVVFLLWDMILVARDSQESHVINLMHS